ncbi:hypothetical protein DFH06DRAFT_1128606 [Mycena polygramma]|nr:hypothetical protein DFH06DRAFT_1128606 [Mycena polygramma]
MAFLRRDPLETVIRDVLLYPADGSEPRIIPMSFSHYGAKKHPSPSYTVDMDLTARYGVGALAELVEAVRCLVTVEGCDGEPLSVSLASYRHIPPTISTLRCLTQLPANFLSSQLHSHPTIMAPPFTKTLSTLNTTQLLSAATDFQLALPATYTVAQLRALVKAHMTANPELMRDPNYAALFTKRARAAYMAQNPPSPTPSSWHGINSGSERSSRAVTPPPIPPTETSASPEPRDLEREARLHVLQSLSPEDLDRALKALVPGNTRASSVAESVDAAHVALASQRRPDRQPGLTASNASYLIPDAIRKRFSQGWKQHVPLQYLTDAFCSRDSTVTAKELDDAYTLEGSRGLISVAKTLPVMPELELTFAEWFQAWARHMELIGTYFPQELAAWTEHYNRILHRPNQQDDWAVCVAYDSEVRRRACTTGIDPAVFHLSIWNDLEAKNIARVTAATVRAELAKGLGIGAGSGSGSGSGRHKAQGPSTGRYHPYSDNAGSSSHNGYSGHKNSFRENPNRLQITGPGVQAQFRCFLCGDFDPSHRSKFCNSPKLINGKDAILYSRKEGEPRTDREGFNYCYKFNGRAGCDRGPNCNHGKHWCSLCGSKDGSHAAQGCSSI